MAKDEKPGSIDPASLTWEQAVAELEAVVEHLEEGEASLEEMLQANRRGNALVTRCMGLVEAAEQEVKELKVSALDEAPGDDGTEAGTPS